MKVFKTLLPFIKKTWYRLAISLFVLLLVDCLQVLIPWIIKDTIDSLTLEGFGQEQIFSAAIKIVILALLMAVLRFAWRVILIGNAFEIEMLLREKLYKHFMKLSQRFFNFSKTGDLMAYATNDLSTVKDFVGWGFLSGVDMVIMTIVSFGFMFYINLQLSLITVIPLPILAFIIYICGQKLNHHYEKVQSSFAEMSGMVQESISGIRIIKAFTQEKPELQKLSKFSKNYVKEKMGFIKVIAVFHPSFHLTISIAMLMVVVFGGRAVINGTISIGSFIAFFTYLGMLIWPMFGIGWFIEMYQSASASMKRVNDILFTEPEIKDNENTNFSINSLNGNIDFRNLSFGYNNDQPILDKLNLSVKTGQTLAISGKTGSGKSTILDLLCRAYNPNKNSIFIDNYDITIIPLNILRESIVLVPQDIFLFSDTVANNIALGNPNAKLDDIIDAAKIAAIYDEILDMEKGFDTIIGERGVTISGGQKQRIAIARAIISNPKVLILDDALSAVDTKTEKIILNNLIDIRKNKTNIIVAHRLSAISHADNIIVLEDGKVYEEGKHNELLRKKGIYYELFEKQKIITTS